DHFISGFLIGEHFAENGYKNIAIIGGPENLKMSALRIEGCIEGLKSACIEVAKENIIHCNLDREREIAAVSNLLLKAARPDAIFCIYDHGATEILKFLQKRNIKIPEEIAVAGCGNDPISDYLKPRLTTIDQQPHKLGELAAEILVNEIITQSNGQPIRQVLRPRLLARESTLKPIL
ncbi:MAG: substrate-binding domain-containing protein, partial [Sediminibacterium sp.]